MPVSERIKRERQARYDRRMAAAAEVVPQGGYCYTPLSVVDGRMHVRMCPYWKYNPRKPAQRTGCCTLMKAADWMPHPRGTSLLWDQVKECGLNDSLDEADADHADGTLE